jgi:hypothetical protein
MLLLAAAAADLADLDPLRDAGQAAGFRGERVGPGNLLRLEPALVPGVAVGGARCEQRLVDPLRLTKAWLAAAVRLAAGPAPGPPRPPFRPPRRRGPGCRP